MKFETLFSLFSKVFVSGRLKSLEILSEMVLKFHADREVLVEFVLFGLCFHLV